MLELCLCVVIFKTSILKAQSHFTLMALPEHYFCHTTSLTDMTPQLLQNATLSHSAEHATHTG
jgi:hypothetical protein